jgi:5-methylcytosine-specific restriction endonuclease McrA
MKRTPLKRGTKQMARTGFKVKSTPIAKKSILGRLSGNKEVLARKPRKKKSTLSKLKKELWDLCREITIKRDGSDCYTCPSKALEGSNRQLGHFISSSICSTELRYDLNNLRIQCYSCNINKSGNWLAYENRLLKENGEDFVKDLKSRNEKTKGLMYREEFYIEKIRLYTALLHTL